MQDLVRDTGRFCFTCIKEGIEHFKQPLKRFLLVHCEGLVHLWVRVRERERERVHVCGDRVQSREGGGGVSGGESV